MTCWSGVVRPILLVLLGGADLLLLIAAVNVAGLLMVRSEPQAGDRPAHGARRFRWTIDRSLSPKPWYYNGDWRRAGLGLARLRPSS